MYIRHDLGEWLQDWTRGFTGDGVINGRLMNTSVNFRCTHKNGAAVMYWGITTIARVQGQRMASILASFLQWLGTVLAKQCFGRAALGGLSVGYGNNDNRLRIGERVEWMVSHSDCKYLH